MNYLITALASFIAGIVLTLIFRIQVETKLKAEKEALLKEIQSKL